MTMGVVDIMMVGHYSGVALAAVALGNLYFFGAIIFGWGVVMALDPVIAQAVGAGDDLGVSRGLRAKGPAGGHSPGRKDGCDMCAYGHHTYEHTTYDAEIVNAP